MIQIAILKRSIYLLPLLCLILLATSMNVSAHKSIEDGNATYYNFSPYDVSKDSWNKRWNVLARKDGNDTGGRNLIYDIYSGVSPHKYKSDWEIQYSSRFGGGSQPYLVFWGWSVIQGYHHHDQNNQATYILAVNKDTKEEKMYKTEMSNVSATKDLEYNKSSNNPDVIWNKCGSTAFNKSNLECNMTYEYVGYKMWIPLKELFPDKNKGAEWQLFIVKNVEGHVVHEPLKLPFEFNKLEYEIGELSLSSGVNANLLKMIGYPVIKRTSPRSTETGAARGYFTKDNFYTRVKQDEDEGTSIWYGVRDGGSTRWASTAYWQFGGSQAILKYEVLKEPVPDPSESVDSGGTGGDISGEVSWYLNKATDTSKSRILANNNLRITGDHYAVRNPSYAMSGSGVFNKQGSSPLSHTVNDPNSLKDKNITYSFQYEFTNYYKDIYHCVDGIAEECFEWTFVKRVADWDKVETGKVTVTLPVDHRYEETFYFSPNSSPELPLTVGRKATVVSNAVSTEKFEETLKVDNSSTTLQTQTWKPINDTVRYSSELGNKLYVLPYDSYYYVDDIDDNLKAKYQNGTPFNYTDYAIPLKAANQLDTAVTFNSQDNFYLTKDTGFLFSVPSSVTSILAIESEAKNQYESFTNTQYHDSVLTSYANGSRYYLNIDGNGRQKPNTWYQDDVVFGKFGLSDVVFHLNRQLMFDRYLLGNPIDNPFINEQQETIKDIEYAHSITLDPNQVKEIKGLAKDRSDLIFGFRSTDIQKKYNQLKNILPALN